MTAPFQSIFPDEIRISAVRIESLVQTYRERRRTGLMRLAYSAEKQIFLLFRSGAVLNSYLREEASSRPLADWQQTIDSTSQEAFARLIPLSAFALRMCRLGIESPVEQSWQAPPFDLRTALTETWMHSDVPRLVHLGWKEAEGLAFYSGSRRDQHSVFYTPNRLVDVAGIDGSLTLWADPQVGVTSYALDLEQSAWQEYFLRSFFADLCQRSLSRYEKITGRTVVEAVIRSMGRAALRRSMEITVTELRVDVAEIFSTPQDAADAYRELLETMLNHISTMIGERLAASIVSEIASELPGDQFGIARRFGLLPQELPK